VVAPANPEVTIREFMAAVAEKVDGRSVVILRQAGEAGQLYGSVNARDIAAAFTEEGVAMERQQVRLAAPIKALGVHEVQVALHPEVAVQVSVNVARSQEEAELQANPELAAAAARAEEEEAAEEAAARAAGVTEAEAAMQE